VNLKVVEKLQLGKLVTPLPDRKRPIYSWFPVKEAFSRNLVCLLTETWGLGEGDLVLDPFAGAGTTLLACKELGLDCVGFDVHPMMLLASRVKLRDYNVEELKRTIEGLMRLKSVERPEVEVPGFVARVFPKFVLEDICSLRQRVAEVVDEGIREFLLLGLSVAAMKCSWAHKDGAAIKVVKRPVPQFKKTLERQLLLMCHDLERFRTKPARVRIEHCDARKLKLKDDAIDAVITSPPYLRKHEYIHAYRIEQWITGSDAPRMDELIGAPAGDATGEDFSEIAEFVKDRPPEAKLYFKDMLAAIKELHRVCRRGAKVCMVASDGCSHEGVVEVCETLCKLAELAGFKTKQMIVVNKRFCTTPARKKVGVTRESLLMWER
jgi:DNA modification methylase